MRSQCVLLCTSNGVGLGHVTRMMAIANQLPTSFEPVLFTLSAAVAIPARAGLAVEHLPSAGHVDISATAWHDLMFDRTDRLINKYRPSVVVFDGVHPYRGFVEALDAHRRRVSRVWVRRAMWKADVGSGAIDREASFDHVIEPGEYAASHDRGATVARRGRAELVAPICYELDRVRPDRANACAELGLDPERTNVLVQLGAGQINDVSSILGSVVTELRRDPMVTIVLARSELSADTDDPADGTVVVRRFPISHWFAAFDLGVMASGYNSFHEALSLGMPTIQVPNLSTKTDDQDARARWGLEQQVAARWDGVDRDELADSVARLLDPEARRSMRRRLELLPGATGAAESAELLVDWAR